MVVLVQGETASEQFNNHIRASSEPKVTLENAAVWCHLLRKAVHPDFFSLRCFLTNNTSLSECCCYWVFQSSLFHFQHWWHYCETYGLHLILVCFPFLEGRAVTGEPTAASSSTLHCLHRKWLEGALLWSTALQWWFVCCAEASVSPWLSGALQNPRETFQRETEAMGLAVFCWVCFWVILFSGGRILFLFQQCWWVHRVLKADCYTWLLFFPSEETL